MKTELYEQVLDNFDKGFASKAARLLIEESKKIFESSESLLLSEDKIIRSDELAKLAVTLHWWGDDPNRQKFQRELIEYQAVANEINEKYERLVEIINLYVQILSRFIPIIDAPWEILRFATPFELVVRGKDPNFSSKEKSDEYMLGRIRDDIIEFISYVTSFSNKIASSLFGRSLRSGGYHVYAQILVDLKQAEGEFEEIEKIQHELQDLIIKRQFSPNRPWVTDNEDKIRNLIVRTLGGSPANPYDFIEVID